MAGEREFEEETRNQMMQNLFGEQSEEEEEEDEDDEEEEEQQHGSDRGVPARLSGYHSEAEGDVEIEGGGEVDIEGQGEVEIESDAEMHGVDIDQGESEAERVQSSQEREVSDQSLESEEKDDQRVESEEKDAESEEHGYGQRVVTSKRREAIPSESERSEEEHRYVDNDEEEVEQARKARSPSEEHDHAVVRDVFGDSDEDEVADYGARNEVEQDETRSPIEENFEKDLRPEDIVPDEDAHYESEDENAELKTKEKPVGPPLELEIPLRRPPGQPDKMNMIKVSNIMGIEPKPFDPKTYVEEDVFVTDESGAKKRIRLEDNIVRWRKLQSRDGTASYESNARFVRWSDGSLQLLIGNEVLDLSVQESQHDHTHLFLRHGKGMLQSQGRLLRKMRFMPSSLSSKSHRLLTALVDSRHKKVYKVKNCITDIDPEREKEEKERAEGQSIRANELLSRKREKVTKKYTPSADRGRQLSPGFLEEALDEDDEPDDYSSRRSAVSRRFEEDMELESQAEKRRSQTLKAVPRKPSLPSARSSRRPVEEYSESEREESEYESEGEELERSPAHRRAQSDNEDEYEELDIDEDTVAAHADSEAEEEERPQRDHGTGGALKRKEFESDEEVSPPRKTVVHRRNVVFDSDEE